MALFLHVTQRLTWRDQAFFSFGVTDGLRWDFSGWKSHFLQLFFYGLLTNTDSCFCPICFTSSFMYIFLYSDILFRVFRPNALTYSFIDPYVSLSQPSDTADQEQLTFLLPHSKSKELKKSLSSFPLTALLMGPCFLSVSSRSSESTLS